MKVDTNSYINKIYIFEINFNKKFKNFYYQSMQSMDILPVNN